MQDNLNSSRIERRYYFFLAHFLSVTILNSTSKFICACCGFGGLSILRKKQTLCQINHSVYMYKISKGWRRLTIFQNVEMKHKEIKLPVLSTLGCADKVSAQESTETACGRAGHRPRLLLGETTGIRCEWSRTHQCKCWVSCKASYVLIESHCEKSQLTATTIHILVFRLREVGVKQRTQFLFFTKQFSLGTACHRMLWMLKVYAVLPKNWKSPRVRNQ